MRANRASRGSHRCPQRGSAKSGPSTFAEAILRAKDRPAPAVWGSKALSPSVSARDMSAPNEGMAEDEEPKFSTQLTGNISNAELDRLIAGFETHPLTQGELRQVKEGVYVALRQSQPEGFEYAFRESLIRRKTDGVLQLLSISISSSKAYQTPQ